MDGENGSFQPADPPCGVVFKMSLVSNIVSRIVSCSDLERASVSHKLRVLHSWRLRFEPCCTISRHVYPGRALLLCPYKPHVAREIDHEAARKKSQTESNMTTTFTTHEEQQLTILQLIDSLDSQTEIIRRLESQTLDLRGFAELDAGVQQRSAREEVEAAPRECVVCGDECVNLYITPCMHVICEDCADSWFVQESKDTCPMCRRRSISTNDLTRCLDAPTATVNQQFESIFFAAGWRSIEVLFSRWMHF